MASGDAADMASTLRAVADLPQRIHAQPGQVAALGLGLVGFSVGAAVGLAPVAGGQVHGGFAVADGLVAAPQVNGLVGLAGGARRTGGGGQARPRARVVVLAALVGAGGQPVHRRKGVDVLLVDLVARRVVGDRAIAARGLMRLQRREGAVVVTEHQPVHAVRVLEVVIDAPLLHQPAQELVVGFVVLNQVVADRELLDQAPLDREDVVVQHRAQHLHRRLVLEDFVVGAQRGQVQPRPQRQLIERMPAVFAQQPGFGDQR